MYYYAEMHADIEEPTNYDKELLGGLDNANHALLAILFAKVSPLKGPLANTSHPARDISLLN